MQTCCIILLAADFEQQLVDDGYVVEFFCARDTGSTKKRLERLYDDPATRWRVSKKKLASVRNYPRFHRLHTIIY